MFEKKLGSEGEQTYALLFEPGDEVMAELQSFAAKHHFTAAHFQGIGALSDLVLGYFDWRDQRYHPIPVDDQVEVLSLHGDVAVEGDRPCVHAQIVVAHADGSAQGGHLLSAHVQPMLEVLLSQSPRHLARHIDKATGLPLLDVNS